MSSTLVLGQELQRLMSLYGLETDQLALALGTDKRTVMRWLASETYPQHASRRAIDALMILDRHLADTFSSPESAREWLWNPSGYFGGLCPVDALLRGRIDAVEASLEAIDSGIFVQVRSDELLESGSHSVASELVEGLRIIGACAVTSWEGFAWRCHARRYHGADHGGSLKATGRFHRASDQFPPVETWPALYTGLAEHVALGEGLRHLANLASLSQWRTTKLHIRLSAVVDLCAETGCEGSCLPGVDLKHLCRPAEYHLTHEIALEARQVAEGLRVPSCTRFPEGCLVIFPDRLRDRSEITVIQSNDPDLRIPTSEWTRHSSS